MTNIRRRVYVETSFVSACVSNRTDPKSIYRRDVSREWWEIQRPFFDVFVSPEVITELESPTYPHSAEALAWIAGVSMLPITDDVLGITQILIKEHLMPQVVAGDAVHVAVSAAHKIDHILSWNVQHLANPNKRQHLRIILARIGIIAPEITTPDLLREI